MGRLAAEEPHDVPAPLPDLDHLPRDLKPDLLDHPQDVPLRRIGVGADDEIGACEEEEMDEMVFHEERVVLKLAHELRRCGRLDAVDLVHGLGRCHVVGRRADAAYIRRDPRHLLHGPADAEALEAPKLRHLKIGVLHIPIVVQEDLDLTVPLQPRYRIYRDSFTHAYTSRFLDASLFFRSREDAVVKR